MKKLIYILLIFALIIGFWLVRMEDPVITLSHGENTQVIEAEFIYNYSHTTAFPSVIRSSGENPVSVFFKGIELSELLGSLNIDYTKYHQMTFIASDGYQISISTEEISEKNNCYIVFEMDGNRLKSKEKGSSGPYRLVIRRDPFSQRWIKHVEEIVFD